MEDDGVRAAVVYQQHALHTLIGSHAKLDGAGVHRHGRKPRSAIDGRNEVLVELGQHDHGFDL